MYLCVRHTRRITHIDIARHWRSKQRGFGWRRHTIVIATVLAGNSPTLKRSRKLWMLAGRYCIYIYIYIYIYVCIYIHTHTFMDVGCHTCIHLVFSMINTVLHTHTHTHTHKMQTRVHTYIVRMQYSCKTIRSALASSAYSKNVYIHIYTWQTCVHRNILTTHILAGIQGQL
jgi:hypothetical protein